jgi:transposase
MAERYEDTGHRKPVSTGGHRLSKLRPYRDFIVAALKYKPDLTLEALGQRLLANRGVKADTGMLSRFLAARWDHQKKTLVARKQDRPDVSRCRAKWRNYQGRIDPGPASGARFCRDAWVPLADR